MIDAISMAPNMDIHPTNRSMVECIGLPHSRGNRFKENYHLLYHKKKDHVSMILVLKLLVKISFSQTCPKQLLHGCQPF
jgi:hypothetical protein